MALLLDDDEVFVPPTKTAKPEVQLVDSQDNVIHIDVGEERNGAVSKRMPASSVHATTTSPSAATRSATVEAAGDSPTVTIARKGGDGMAKMDALLFGKPKVAVISGSRTAGSTMRKAATCEETVDGAAAITTPKAQRTLPSASLSNSSSEQRSTASNVTQPKVVSPARSSLSASPNQRQSSAASLEETVLRSQDDVMEVRGAHQSPTQSAVPSQASPPARPPTKPVVAETTESAPPTQPAKTQMKLSDFFSKMACKR